MSLPCCRVFSFLACFLSLFLPTLNAAEEDYLVTKASPYTFEETCQRAASKAKAGGFEYLSEYRYKSPDGQHQSTVFLYQNARLSNALLQHHPLSALILPFKLIIWEKDRRTWVTYLLATVLDELDVLEDASLLEQVIEAIEHFTDEITFAPLPDKGLS